jgi:hypothetical protein
MYVRHHPARSLVRPAVAVLLVAAVAVVPRAWDARRLSPEVEALADSIAADDLRTMVTDLAGDAMQGRGVGHEGNDRAVAYLASRLARLGLRPVSGDAYRQPVPLLTAVLGPGTALRLPTGTATRPRELAAGADFYPLVMSPAGDAEGPVGFTGFGPDALSDAASCPWPELGGRVLVGLDGERAGARPGSGAATRPGHTVAERARTAARCGAVALLLASEDGRGPSFRATWPTRVSATNRPVFLQGDVLGLPVARISLSLAATVLGPDARGRARRGTRLWEAATRAARSDAAGPLLAEGPPTHRVRLRIDVETRPVAASNLAGFVEGLEPAVRQQTVVVGAHLDHDGVDADGRVFNGADDNASGTAAVLEIAEAFTRAAALGARPRRAVVFALWNAEEKGLLGSRHFVAGPLPPGRRPIAYVNLDMVGRNEEVPAAPDPRFRGLAPTSPRANTNAVDLVGYTRSPQAAAVVGQESGAVGLEVRERFDTHVQNLLRRSDQWSFLEAGIPALGFTTGLHPDYHLPSDDADRIDYRKLERVSRLAFRVAWRLADAAEPPALVPATTEP